MVSLGLIRLMKQYTHPVCQLLCAGVSEHTPNNAYETSIVHSFQSSKHIQTHASSFFYLLDRPLNFFTVPYILSSLLSESQSTQRPLSIVQQHPDLSSLTQWRQTHRAAPAPRPSPPGSCARSTIRPANGASSTSAFVP